MKLKTHYVILIVCGAYFLLNGLIPRNDSVLSAKVSFLMNEGWSRKSSEHIAKVELKLIPADEEYTAYMED